ncbi:MAG: CRISPR-associated helicase Cas3' [Anaerolineae bacterium]|nr:CRISPR-associated helicase Cas3' [Anaerolineae bacterium]
MNLTDNISAGIPDMSMPPVDPDLHTVLAKSDGESLVTHTWLVLSRLADQRRLRPTLAIESACPRLWHWLYWGTFLHDFGKIADGFQAVLAGKARQWGFRHEALSLAFVDWLFPGDHPDRQGVIAVIACHHRDANDVTKTYMRNRYDPDEDSATKLIRQVSETHCRRLYRWLTEHSAAWAEALGFAADIAAPDFPSWDEARARVTPSAIHRAIGELKGYTESLDVKADVRSVLVGTLLRGLILTADHAGSAHSEPFLPAPLEREAVTGVLGDARLFPHQTAAGEAPPGSVLLISPTSSGKTEAALLWLARQQAHDGRPAPRVFYLLPYQASMNAAQKRLKRAFPEDTAVGLQHSRMMQVLYAQALEDRADNDLALAFAHQQRELSRLLHFPVTVMSPYQILKVPYQLKGFEALLANFYGARFILDEIHAYDPARLALIVAVAQFLHEHCRARFFIMTATLPPQVRAQLQAALPDLQVITANADTFRRFQRHRVHVLPGDLLAAETVERIVADAASKSILICCNTVRRAMDVHAAIEQALAERYPDGDYRLILLHSRFNNGDRQEYERQIIERTEVNSKRRGRTVVVATQVVEVSLNIDLDTLYSEAAPLEALLQRFGRVNRGRPAGSPLADVYVAREQPDAAYRIYARELIDAALACLDDADGQPIDESLVSGWLERVYVGDALARWQSKYEASSKDFQSRVMTSLRPFNSSHLEELFYEMFDGVDVLPACFLDAYEKQVRAGQYLEATRWLVPIAWRDYKRLERMGKTWQDRATERGRYVYVVNAPYSSQSGLDLYSVYAGSGTADQPPGTALDSYAVPPEAD